MGWAPVFGLARAISDGKAPFFFFFWDGFEGLDLFILLPLFATCLWTAYILRPFSSFLIFGYCSFFLFFPLSLLFYYSPHHASHRHSAFKFEWYLSALRGPPDFSSFFILSIYFEIFQISCMASVLFFFLGFVEHSYCFKPMFTPLLFYGFGFTPRYQLIMSTNFSLSSGIVFADIKSILHLNHIHKLIIWSFSFLSSWAYVHLWYAYL